MLVYQGLICSVHCTTLLGPAMSCIICKTDTTQDYHKTLTNLHMFMYMNQRRWNANGICILLPCLEPAVLQDQTHPIFGVQPGTQLSNEFRDIIELLRNIHKNSLRNIFMYTKTIISYTWIPMNFTNSPYFFGLFSQGQWSPRPPRYTSTTLPCDMESTMMMGSSGCFFSSSMRSRRTWRGTAKNEQNQLAICLMNIVHIYTYAYI